MKPVVRILKLGRRNLISALSLLGAVTATLVRVAAMEALYDEAKKHGWPVISMKNDWKQILAFG